eukprot:scaffold319136_cov21-Tisochrysis_lutea.AAC.2
MPLNAQSEGAAGKADDKGFKGPTKGEKGTGVCFRRVLFKNCIALFTHNARACLYRTRKVHYVLLDGQHEAQVQTEGGGDLRNGPSIPGRGNVMLRPDAKGRRGN